MPCHLRRRRIFDTCHPVVSFAAADDPKTKASYARINVLEGLQSVKDEADAEKASIMQQFEDVVGRRTGIDQEQATLLVELNKIKGQIHNFEEARQGVQKKIEDAATSHLESQSNKNHYTKKLEDETTKVEANEAITKQLQEEFMNWTSSAEEYCERVEHPRKVDVVERTLESA